MSMIESYLAARSQGLAIGQQTQDRLRELFKLKEEKIESERKKREQTYQLQMVDLMSKANDVFARSRMSPEEESMLRESLNNARVGLGLDPLNQLPDVVTEDFLSNIHKQQAMRDLAPAERALYIRQLYGSDWLTRNWTNLKNMLGFTSEIRNISPEVTVNQLLSQGRGDDGRFQQTPANKLGLKRDDVKAIAYQDAFPAAMQSPAISRDTQLQASPLDIDVPRSAQRPTPEPIAQQQSYDAEPPMFPDNDILQDLYTMFKGYSNRTLTTEQLLDQYNNMYRGVVELMKLPNYDPENLINSLDYLNELGARLGLPHVDASFLLNGGRSPGEYVKEASTLLSSYIAARQAGMPDEETAEMKMGILNSLIRYLGGQPLTIEEFNEKYTDSFYVPDISPIDAAELAMKKDEHERKIAQDLFNEAKAIAAQQLNEAKLAWDQKVDTEKLKIDREELQIKQQSQDFKESQAQLGVDSKQDPYGRTARAKMTQLNEKERAAAIHYGIAEIGPHLMIHQPVFVRNILGQREQFDSKYWNTVTFKDPGDPKGKAIITDYRLSAEGERRIREQESKEIIQQSHIQQNGGEMMKTIRSYIGTPYKYAGTSKSGIDCSALAQQVLASGNVSIPRTCATQWKQGSLVKTGTRNSPNFDNLIFGDLVFLKGTQKGIKDKSVASHVMIYIGRNAKGEPLVVHSGVQSGVSVTTLKSKYNLKHFLGVRRYTPAPATVTKPNIATTVTNPNRKPLPEGSLLGVLPESSPLRVR